MRVLLLCCAVMAGCGGAPDPEPTTPAPSAGVVMVEIAPETNPRHAVLPAHTLWNGRYECAQGVTGLMLTLDLDGSGRASAVFDFGAAPENPTVPTGRYLMTGRFDPTPDGSGTYLTLVPDRWVLQPPGYVMVGLTAAIDASARSMQGRIDNPSCTVLALSRLQ